MFSHDRRIEIAETETDVSEAVSNRNPYLSARRTWNDYISSQVALRKLWQIVAFGSLMSTLLAVAGVIYFASQNHFIPYVVRVDNLERVSFDEVMKPVRNNDPRIINLMISDFVTASRTVVFDGQMQAKLIDSVYAKMLKTDPAYQKMTDLYMPRDPSQSVMELTKKISRNVTVYAILPITDQTYSVEWNEVTRDTTGKRISDLIYKGTVQIKFLDNQKASFESVMKNPIGLYVIDFSYQKISK